MLIQNIALGACTLLILTACHGRSESSHHAGDYEIERLFEQDGCFMYRFRDNGMKYFMTCGHNAVTQVNKCVMVGKTYTCEETRIQTATKE